MHENPNQQDSTAQSLRQVVRFLRVLWHRRLVMAGLLTLFAALGSLHYLTAYTNFFGICPVADR